MSEAGRKPQDESDFSQDSSCGVVAILSLGLMGGSLGLALRHVGAAKEVVGWARRQETLDAARQRGAIDRAEADIRAAVQSVDAVILAAPVDSILPLLERIVPHCAPETAITDVGSAKARIVEEAERIAGGQFVGSHPMAGSEQSGIAAASADLYRNAPWILTPTARTNPAVVERIERMAQAVGAKPRRCDPAKHDQLVANISHLPHLLAYGLAQTASDQVEDEWVDLIAGSFRDGTRVSNSDPALWTEILLDNRTATLEALDSFNWWMTNVRNALRKGDEVKLAELLSSAHSARKRFPK